jgi:hypothetical protein
MKVFLSNPNTGEVKSLKVGFSWTCFFFSGFFGVPLFIRNLTNWGLLMVAIVVINILLSVSNSPSVLIMSLLLGIGNFGLSIYFGLKGNELAAKNYLDHGWTFAEPNSEFVRYARQKWALA